MATTPSTVNPVQPFGVSLSLAPAYWPQGILWTIPAAKEQPLGPLTRCRGAPTHAFLNRRLPMFDPVPTVLLSRVEAGIGPGQ
jgi:hypothetical protein